jgi:hypothetical protein
MGPAAAPPGAAPLSPAERKEAFIAALRQLWVNCGSPTGRQLVAVSERLARQYSPPGRPELRLPVLSKSTISEVLGGKRRRNLPDSEWVTIWVLSCQHLGALSHNLLSDPEMSTVPRWQALLRQAGRTPDDGPGVVAPLAGDPVWMTPRHHGFVASHGPYGDELLARVEAGQPDGIFQAAVLLGCAPSHAADAHALLLYAASGGCQAAAGLLDENLPGVLDPAVAARCAHRLAQAAEDRGATSEAHAFYQAAARGGVRDAVVKHAAAKLEQRGEPQAAAWLAPLADPPDAEDPGPPPDGPPVTG